MSKKASKKRSVSVNFTPRTHLPDELQDRLRAVWRRIGHLVDWCDSSEAWVKMFCSEVRPYRETFYWDAIAQMVSDYVLEHPEASPGSVLSDCLISTQCSSIPEDPAKLADFRRMWGDILAGSRPRVETFIQADLDLAAVEGNYEMVARLYAADYGRWEMGEKRNVPPDL